MIFFDRRRPPFSTELFYQVGLVWLLASVIMIAVNWQGIVGLRLPDGDDALRLVQLRDLVAGQAWFDLHQYRIDPPQGVLMHWSRLVDLPLLLIYSVLAPLLGADLAERLTLVLVPLLTLGAALLLIGRLAWRLFGQSVVPYACIVLVLCSTVTAQLQPMRIDHHGWQIVCFLAALNGLAARDAHAGGNVAGVAMGLGVAISMELLPLAAMIGAAAAWRWLRDAKAGELCQAYLRALALTAVFAFVVTRGVADAVNHCDALSPAYLAGLLVMAIAFAMLGRIDNLPPLLLALGMVVAVAAGIGQVLGLAPQCIAGPFAMLDPLVKQYWYGNVLEGLPIWHQDPAAILRMIVPPLVGIWAMLRLWQRSGGWLGRFWDEYLLIALGALGLAVMVSRSAIFVTAMAAVPLGWYLSDWRRRAIEAGRRYGPKAALGLILVLIAAPHLPLATFRMAAPALASAGPRAGLACDVPAAAQALRALPAATIFAPIDSGPLLLLHSDHSVVATAHHRGVRGLHDTIAGFLVPPETAEAFVRRRGARYVLICPALTEAAIYRAAAPQGLMSQLAQGRAPAWLRPVALPRQSGLLMWEVMPQSY